MTAAAEQAPFYEQDGVRYPRVSAILSILRDPDIEASQERVGEKASRAKALHTRRIGIKLDSLIKQELQGKIIMTKQLASSELKQGWKAWLEYRRLHPRPVSVGIPLTSKVYGYGGEPDLFRAVPGEEDQLVADLKATSRIREKHWIQLTAYVPLLWPERFWPQVRLRIIRLDTFLGTCEVKERPFVRQVWETFMSLKKVYQDWFSNSQEDSHVSHC